MTMDGIDVLVSEVGPRDGLQNVKAVMPTAAKKRWIDALVAAGLREIEVGSFVPAKLLPQLADTAEIVRHARSHPGLTVAVLVPNVRGASDAIAAGAHKLTLPLSVSETHSIANLRQNHEQVLAAARAISALCAEVPEESRPSFEVSLSTVFGCTLEGAIPDDTIRRLSAELMESGCDEIGLSDTTGYATPDAVVHVVDLVRSVAGREAVTGLHLHNTRGLGLANVLAGLSVGITTFDASSGGLGGCPFAPGASGNIVTEDLVFMLESMGKRTGIDLQALITSRSHLAAALPGEPLYGFIADAGLPKGFVPASPPNFRSAA
jgi:hydroxymethylglutaryl-CoA lyase